MSSKEADLPPVIDEKQDAFPLIGCQEWNASTTVHTHQVKLSEIDDAAAQRLSMVSRSRPLKTRAVEQRTRLIGICSHSCESCRLELSCSRADASKDDTVFCAVHG